MPGSESHGDDRRRSTSPTNSGLWEAAQRFWQKSYAGDYVGLMLLVAGYMVVRLGDEPFHQMFTLNDPRIQHPHAEIERVPVSMLFAYAGGAPALLLLLHTLLVLRNPHKAHVTLLGLVITILTTSFLTDIFKNAIGRPRPDLIARCKPGDGASPTDLVSVDICTETDHHTLHDGFRSFPSGHSSFAFAGLGWLALYLAAQTHVLRPRASQITVLLCVAPLVAAALIAISRLEDYRHDVFDVVCGSILGFLITCVNWRRYYPSLWAADCEEPYEPLGAGRRGSKTEFQRVRDEEEGYGSTGFRGGDDGEGYRMDGR